MFRTTLLPVLLKRTVCCYSIRSKCQNKTEPNISQTSTSGLLDIPLLTSPQGFQTFWNESLTKCQKLLSDITQEQPNYKTIEKFDQISNFICLVADSANFISENHSSKEITSAARDVSLKAQNYVETLNTNKRLFQAIKTIVDDEKLFHSLTPEQQHTAVMFVFDFEQSGIHLPKDQRVDYVKLNADLLQIAYNFMGHTIQPVFISPRKCPTELLGFPRHKGKIVLTSSEVDNPYDDVREASWKHFHKHDKLREDLLCNMLNHRHALATKVGFTNFAERELRGTIAKTQRNVHDFLSELHRQLYPLVEVELEQLKYKSQHSQRKHRTINMWDAPYYASESQSRFISENKYPLGMFSNSFNIKHLMKGLTTLLEQVFGITLVEEVPKRGELWSDEVIKLSVQDEKEGVLGIIYCDFLRRDGKDNKTCLYTIQCGTVDQIPITAMQCNFGKGENLKHDQIENFFHEFGHAIHATLGRTRYQHVSGTRGPTDLAEIPSILFEHFVSLPEVFALILPDEGCHVYNHTLLPINSVYNATLTETQLLYSMIDLQLHSGIIHGTTTSTVSDLQKQYSHLPYSPGTSWHLRFSHLYTYGARYYSYLWARSISNIIHQELFSNDPMSRESGEAVKSFLKYGGSRDPRWLVEELIGSELTIEKMVWSLISPIKKFTHEHLLGNK